MLLVSFSNRAFWTKAPRIWLEGNDEDHIQYICAILSSQGWSAPDVIREKTTTHGVFGVLGFNGDPFFSVIGVA